MANVMPEGIVEKLTRHSGHWLWVRDDASWDEHVRKVWGPQHFELGRSLLSAKTCRPHHWFTNGGGHQVNHRIVNALTGPNGNSVLKDYSGEPSARPFKLPNGEVMKTTERVMVENDTLKQETTGGPTPTGQRKHDLMIMKVSSEASGLDQDEEFEMAMEDKILGDGVVGRRYFRRHPCYHINNDTDEKVQMWIYSASDPLCWFAKQTLEVDYGMQYIDASSFETEEEQACFERHDGKRYWTILRPFSGCVTLDKEKFETGGKLALCSSKRCS